MEGALKNPRTWSIQCLIDWLKIRQEQGQTVPTNAEDFAAEVDHSALLRRLIEGKQPLPNPPPLSYSYPWYELMEKGWAIPTEVWEGNEKFNAEQQFQALVINQQPWRIVDKRGPEDFLVTYGDGQRMFRCWVTGLAADDKGTARKSWKIEKV